MQVGVCHKQAVCMGVCGRECMCACVRACVRARSYVCVKDEKIGVEKKGEGG